MDGWWALVIVIVCGHIALLTLSSDASGDPAPDEQDPW